MSQQFRTVTTNAGRNAIRAALAQGKTVKLSHMSVGDGGGNPVTPLATMTKLVNERFRAQINDITLDPSTPDLFTSELFIPQAEGGWYIREVGLWMDDGTLFAVGNTPLTEKPDLSSGAATDLLVRLIIRVLDASTVSIEIDPAQVLATREYVDRKVDAHNKDGGAHETPARKNVQFKAGTGLSGGGNLEADRTLAVVYGNTAGTACQGNDVRLADARTPKAHKTTHKTGGTDAITPEDIGAASKDIQIVAGPGLSGGGPLSGDVTIKAKLTDSVDLSDSDTAASATAVKTAYDAAQSKLPLDGGIMTGGIQINDPTNDVAVAPPANTERGLFLADKNGAIMGGFDVIQRASDNAKWTQIFAKNSAGQFTTLSIDIKENGEGEVNSTSPIQINDVRIGRLFANNVRLITLSGARGNEGLPLRYSPDNGELYLDGRAVHGKADTAGHADSAGTATKLATPRTINGVGFDGSKNITVADPTKLPLSGGIMTGGIQINDPTNDVAVAPPVNTERGLFLADKNGAIVGGFDVIQRASDNAKWTQIFAKNSKGQFTTLSIDINEDGTGEVNSTSPVQINDVRISRVFDNGVRLISLSGARGNEGLPLRYSPDNGELYLDGRAVHGKADAAGNADYATNAGYADAAQSAYGLTGVQVVSFDYPNTQTLPGYGTWMVYYSIIVLGSVYNIISDIMPGGTVLTLDRANSMARGTAIRTA